MAWAQCMHPQERIAELEAQALSEKEWTMRGEINASHRPLNSALEVDMDFDTTGLVVYDIVYV